ncbi:magnesium transporter [Anoxybacillus calidus]|jgi:magnesium transporter|uniref:Magnesium transporter n=1 Tax=[Anoxybacillus] calidus TaxID=575178 RepID=A0A7V9Z167_9BACL|nr:magnesium transporter CorA family protein [Anoxybacillus calidus]MBA2872191.1 magnesium transporter [Anoxybacillus calidus]
MIHYYLSDETGLLKKQSEITKGSWIQMINPTPEEIEYITNALNIPDHFIKDALDTEERSRIEKEEDAVLIIVDYPYVTVDDEIYETIPIGLIITKDNFVTVSLYDAPILHDFIDKKVKGFYTYKKTRFAFQLLYVISTYYLRYLKQIDKKADEIERELHQSLKNKELYGLLALGKSLVYFTTSLRSNKIVMEKMLRQNYLKMYEEDKDLLEDVLIEYTQAIEMADTYSTILSNMMDAFASIISNNLNIVMKFLTSITIVLSFPTMVASFYGMNVDLPFQHHPHAFFIPLTFATILSTTTAIIFWKKRFF